MNHFQNFRLLMLVALIAASSGCQSLGPNATAGGLFGATGGGLMGAAIGASEGKSGEGALIGALAGGVAGTAIGDQADQADARQRDRFYQRQQAASDAAVTMEQVIHMTRSGVGDELIVNQINLSGAAAPPTPDDLILLKTNGVSDAVIQALQSVPRPMYPVANLQRRPATVFVQPDGYCPAPYFGPPVIVHPHHYPAPFHRPHCRPGNRASFAVSF